MERRRTDDLALECTTHPTTSAPRGRTRARCVATRAAALLHLPECWHPLTASLSPSLPLSSQTHYVLRRVTRARNSILRVDNDIEPRERAPVRVGLSLCV